jgi:PE family
MMAATVETASNVATTAGVITGAAPAVTAPPPAGTDEASALATANTSVHAADFLATSAQAFLEMARYAGTIALADGSYTVVDAANCAQFV